MHLRGQGRGIKPSTIGVFSPGIGANLSLRVYSPKQLFDQFLTLYFKVSSNLIHDAAQSPDSERFVSGNGDVMFKAFRVGCEPHMATGLASYLIALPA